MGFHLLLELADLVDHILRHFGSYFHVAVGARNRGGRVRGREWEREKETGRRREAVIEKEREVCVCRVRERE